MAKQIPDYLGNEAASRWLAREIEMWWATRGQAIKTEVYRGPEGFWCIRSDLRFEVPAVVRSAG